MLGFKYFQSIKLLLIQVNAMDSNGENKSQGNSRFNMDEAANSLRHQIDRCKQIVEECEQKYLTATRDTISEIRRDLLEVKGKLEKMQNKPAN